MAGYPGQFTRVTRVGLNKTSGWKTLADSAFFTPSPPDQAHNTFNDLTSAATGGHSVGTGAATLDTIVSGASGGVGASGTSAATLATIVSTASGSTTHGTSAATLATIVSTATGGSTHGTSAATLATITSAGAGFVTYAGSVATTLAALTSTASGARGASGTGVYTGLAIGAEMTSQGQAIVTYAGSVATTLDGLVSVGTDAPDRVTIIFDDGTIPANFYWSDSPGSVVNRPDGIGGTSKALQFPDIDDSEETYFEIYVNARDGNNLLTVRYEVSSEAHYDFLRVYVDGVHVLYPSGSDNSSRPGRSGTGEGWVEFSAALTVGARLIKFAYSKDSSADDGDDTAWLSKIIVSPLTERPVTAASVLDDLDGTASGTVAIFPGHRIFRIYMAATSSLSGTCGGIAEIELRGSLGGADLTDTNPGTATQYLGSGSSGSFASNLFDNDLETNWYGWETYGGISWEFTQLPQDIAQLHFTLPSYSTVDGPIFGTDLLDIRVERQYGLGDAYDVISSKRGIVEPNDWTTPGEFTIDLVGPGTTMDGYLGNNAFGATASTREYCLNDHLAVTAHTTWNPIRIERLITYSAIAMPWVPWVGAPVRTFFIRGVIYANDGPGGTPGTLLAVSNERTEAPNDWFELTMPAPLFLMPQTFWIGVHVGGDDGIYSRDTYGGQTSRTVEATYTSGVPATFPTGSTVQIQPHPIYAIYPISTGLATLESLTSDAVGTHGIEAVDPITAEAVALILGELLGDATGTVTHPPPRLRRVSLIGYDRRTVTLHGTVRHP